MVITGITSLLPIIIYGWLGLAGIMLAIYSFKQKQWLQVIIFLLPIIMTIGATLILGP